jgi:succinate dehydrogenase / fumarate reductase cytochrome b subunit
MHLFSDSIGRKVVMAVTGLLMVLFVIGHLLGNLTIFAGANGINAYAVKLHQMAPVVWGTRVVMGLAVLFHVFLSVQLTLENSAAKPDKYAVSKQLKATFNSTTMIWTGLIIGAFIVFHLVHFTLRAAPPADAVGRPDVYAMVVAGLGKVLSGLVYLVAMVSLFFHVGHGIQSAFQTLGLTSRSLMPKYQTLATALSTIFLIGFGSIPAVILAGILK